MIPSMSPALMLLVSALVAIAAGVQAGPLSPLERAFEDRRLQGINAFNLAKRQTRSATGGVPCVTVPFLTELKERFSKWLDHNNDGVSVFDEVRNYLQRFKPSVSNEAVAAFIGRRDLDGNGAIDFVPEYVQDLSAPDYTLEGATEWYQLQDTNDDGYVSESELHHMAQTIGMTPEEAVGTVRDYYMSQDKDGDNRLSFEEFKSLYNQ